MTTVSFAVYNKLHQTSETLEDFVEDKDMLFSTTVVAMQIKLCKISSGTA